MFFCFIFFYFFHLMIFLLIFNVFWMFKIFFSLNYGGQIIIFFVKIIKRKITCHLICHLSFFPQIIKYLILQNILPCQETKVYNKSLIMSKFLSESFEQNCQIIFLQIFLWLVRCQYTLDISTNLIHRIIKVTDQCFQKNSTIQKFWKN